MPRTAIIRSSPFQRNRDATQRYSILLAVYALAGILTIFQFQGPKVCEGEYEEEVAAWRVREQLVYLLGPEQAIHNSGTPANDAVRRRLIGRLRQLDLEVNEIPFQVEGVSMVNLLAHHPGRSTFRPILIASHYDSCKTGPGAGDALGCVAAILEAVRVIRLDGCGAEFWILLTDGEEGGLLGAQAFVDGPKPWSDRNPFVINLDARGTSCAASMFETQEENYGYVRSLKEALGKPSFTTSLMVNVYNLLPNKTDYSVFKKENWPGFNFAIIGSPHRYHTLEDTPVNLSDRSLQNFADHAYRLLSELTRWSDVDWNRADSEMAAVFFDLFGLYVICYPSYFNPILSVVGWILFGFLLFRFNRINPIRMKYIASLFTASLAIILASVLIGGGLSRLMKGWLIERKYVEFGEVGALGYTFLAIFLCTTFGAWAFRQRNLYHARLGLLFGLNLMGTFGSILLPGGAYLFHFPVLIWSILCLIRPTHRWVDMLSFMLFALIHAPLLALLPIAMGPLAGGILGGASAVLLFPLMALYSEFPKRHSFDFDGEEDRVE